jgi:hypothetical protein
MKMIVSILLALVIAAAVVGYLTRPAPAPAPGTEPEAASESAASGSQETEAPASPVVASTRRPTQTSLPEAPGAAVAPASNSAFPAAFEATRVSQAVDILVSSQVPYAQKQAAMNQLKAAGKLDVAIGDLEQRMANDPRTAEYPAALGQAYLQKCTTIQDVREMGILGMQADKVFDTALAIDPANWEARFTKALAMSYWPASLNKGEEIVQHFQTLIQQQEAQAPQPQFAETYSWLGEQYRRSGQNEQARAVWERGLSLFPSHEGLKSKLSAPL